MNNQTVTAVPVYPGTPLKMGSRGDDVKTMQYYLNSVKGNMIPTLPQLSVDGIFGTGTQTAVISYQTARGLATDGIIGRNSWNAIANDFVTIPANDRYVYPGSPISSGSSGVHVGVIQMLLNEIAPTYASLRLLSMDGKFGANTASTVRLFQKQFSLSADEVVGQRTWSSVVDANTAVRSGTPRKVTTAYPGSTLSVGSSGDSVRFVQSYMDRVGKFYSAGFPVVKVDGIFGAANKALVNAFQNYFGLKADGIVGTDTWNRMVSEYNTAL